MSLINQMLQDLDSRRAAHGVGANLANDVRPLPRRQASRLPFIMGVVVLAVLVGVFALYQWEIKRQAAPAIAPVLPGVAAPEAVKPIPAATMAPTLPEPENIVHAQSLPAEQAPNNMLTLQDMDGSLRMADSLKLPAEKKGEAKPDAVASRSEKTVVADKKAADERSKAEPSERQVPPATGVSPPGASRPVRNPLIERTDSPGSPRERAEAEYRKAVAAVNLGRVDEALEGLRKALGEDALHIASRQLLVRLLLEARRPDEAAQLLQEGLHQQPAQIGWAMSLARLQVDRGDLAGAWQTLNFSLPAAGNNADYQGFAAHVLQRLGRHKEAAGHYQAATRLSPGDGRWWLGLGLSMEAEGRSSEAREAFMRARQSSNLSAELTALVEHKLRQP